MAKPDPRRLFEGLPGGEKPSITASTLRTFALHVGLSEPEALKKIEEMAGGKVEVVEPTEPFIVIVTDYRVVATSREVACSLCGTKCWAAESYGPLATYLCIACAQSGDLNARSD